MKLGQKRWVHLGFKIKEKDGKEQTVILWIAMKKEDMNVTLEGLPR